jgi:PHD/YefM family antitoxin component YafN of YafNO toxin-antitoxin module
MKIYTYSQARQSLAKLLDQAWKEGAVRIKRRDGQTFIIQPERSDKSPLDVLGVDLDLSAAEIVEFVREGRRPPP